MVILHTFVEHPDYFFGFFCAVLLLMLGGFITYGLWDEDNIVGSVITGIITVVVVGLIVFFTGKGHDEYYAKVTIPENATYLEVTGNDKWTVTKREGNIYTLHFKGADEPNWEEIVLK